MGVGAFLQVAVGAERLKIRRVIAATPDHGLDVVEVLGGGAADLAEFQPVRHAWADGYVVRAFNVLLGEEGVGKGTLLSSLIARFTRGTLPGAYVGTRVRVLWVGDEDGWHDVVGPRLFAAAAAAMVEELHSPGRPVLQRPRRR